MARFEEFWDVMCAYRPYIWLGVMVCLFLFVLSLMSLFLAPRGTGAFYISIVNFVMVLVLGSVTGWAYWVCIQRAKDRY